MKGLFTALLDLILPPRATERFMRTVTLKDLHELSYGSLNGALPYREMVAKTIVWEIKYHGDMRAAALGGEFLSETLLGVAAEEIGTPLLIPIPMHPAREKERGHNQTELLCEFALKHLGENTYEYAPHILKRIRNTRPQQGLAQHIRLNNVKNSMCAEGPDAGRIKGRVCVVVDDVSTTGATFEEAKRALKLAGARSVTFVSLAS